MEENEQLFLLLMSLHTLDSRTARELIQTGYLTEDLGGTPRSREFVDRFVKSKKELLYRAIKDMGTSDDSARIMARVGISHTDTFEIIAEALLDEGRLEKDRYGKYRVLR